MKTDVFANRVCDGQEATDEQMVTVAAKLAGHCMPGECVHVVGSRIDKSRKNTDRWQTTSKPPAFTKAAPRWRVYPDALTTVSGARSPAVTTVVRIGA